MIRPEQLRSLATHARPVIGVHIRHGDFRPLRPGEDFAKVGLVRVPLVYFRSRVLALRQVLGELPVTVFSDGRDEDLREVLDLPNVSRSNTASDLVDLLLLAQSQLILPAPGSSFAHVATFLADAPVMHDPRHFHAPARPPEVNARWFEGPVSEFPEEWPPLLMENLERIRAGSSG